MFTTKLITKSRSQRSFPHFYTTSINKTRPQSSSWLNFFFCIYPVVWTFSFKVLLFKKQPSQKLCVLSHLTWRCSVCGPWTHSRPSQTQPPPPVVPTWRTCSCPGLRWWCPPPGPRSAATPQSDGRPRPSPQWPAGEPQARGSWQRWPES